MRQKHEQIRNGVFFVLVGIFVVVSVWIVGVGGFGRGVRRLFPVIAALAIVFGLLGLVQVILTAGIREGRARKVFFLLTGASAAGIPICAILHNLLYGLFIIWFGEGFWGKPGMSDEPVFFILGILVCPALFVIGSVGSVVVLIKARITGRANVP